MNPFYNSSRYFNFFKVEKWVRPQLHWICPKTLILPPDPLFFLQLLLTICDPKRSGIEDDDRMPFFMHAHMCTNVYALGEKSLGGGTGHKFSNVE